MNNSEALKDDEELYRNVRGKLEDKEYSIQDDKLIIFKLLQIALATLATKNGWTIEPSSE